MSTSPRISLDPPKFFQRHMMDLTHLIDSSRVIFAARASNKEQLLRDFAARAAVLLNLEARTIFDALNAREELGSTGLGDGFALPHARVEGLDHFFGMFRVPNAAKAKVRFLQPQSPAGTGKPRNI